MRSVVRRCPSRSMVVAGVALVAAISGTAVAARHYVVSKSSQVKPGALSARNLSASARRTLKGQRGPRGFAGANGLPGATGAQGPAGPAGPSAVSKITRTEAVATVAAGDVDGVTANCPAGQGIVGGGYRSIGADTEVFGNDTFGSPNSWSALLDNFDSTISAEIRAIAYCAPSGQAIAAKINPGAVRRRITADLEARRAAHQ
jgi:hypothetical protein